jgi:NAD(P)-dependent dehydrogenase (short-subunit alcohol dehydrogenase family)
MERQGSGAIVNNASVGALTGNPGIASYVASKHGVVGLTRTAGARIREVWDSGQRSESRTD